MKLIQYIVCPGDTLSYLASVNNTTVEEIMRYNPEIKDPDLIYVGQILVIPVYDPVIDDWTINYIKLF